MPERINWVNECGDMVFVRLGKASSVIPEHVPWPGARHKLQFAANAPAVALEVMFDVLYDSRSLRCHGAFKASMPWNLLPSSCPWRERYRKSNITNAPMTASNAHQHGIDKSMGATAICCARQRSHIIKKGRARWRWRRHSRKGDGPLEMRTVSISG